MRTLINTSNLWLQVQDFTHRTHVFRIARHAEINDLWTCMYYKPVMIWQVWRWHLSPKWELFCQGSRAEVYEKIKNAYKNGTLP